MTHLHDVKQETILCMCAGLIFLFFVAQLKRILYSEEQAIQQLVAGMAKWKTTLACVVPCTLIIFWGSWSDRHGRRKPCMLMPILGEILMNLGMMGCVYFDRTTMEMTGILEAVLPALGGLIV